MASEQQVKQYLAYWFQLGKPVFVQGEGRSLLPSPVIQGDRYSKVFEDCWQTILASETSKYYLEGTQQTIGELLTPAWEISPCCRCSMPVPLRSLGVPESPDCVCADLSHWPNYEIPTPREPVNNQTLLLQIRDRLRQTNL